MSTAVLEERPIIRTAATRAAESFAAGGAAAGRPWPTELELRAALPPPLPLDALLAALRELPAGAVQYVRIRQEPVALLDALAERGIEAQARVVEDGTWRLCAVVPDDPVRMKAPRSWRERRAERKGET